MKKYVFLKEQCDGCLCNAEIKETIFPEWYLDNRDQKQT